VFDDGAVTNEYVSHADQRKSSSNARRHSNTSRHSKGTNIYHEPSTSDHQIVAPVESPVEDPEEAKPEGSKDSDTSFFGRISEFGKRAKRQLNFNLFGNEEEPEKEDSLTTTEGKGFLGLDSGAFFDWFSGSDRKKESYESHTSEVASSAPASDSESGETQQESRYRIKRSTTQDDDVASEVDEDELKASDDLDAGDKESGVIKGGDVESATNQVQGEDKDDDESYRDAVAVHRHGPFAARRRGQAQLFIPDDEDYIGEAASGSGMDGTTAPPTWTAPPPDRQPSEY